MSTTPGSTPTTELQLPARILSASILASLVISFPSWLGTSSFPTVPLFEIPESVAFIIRILAGGMLLGALALIPIRITGSRVLIGLSGWLAFVLLDWALAQPYLYQQLLLLLLLVLMKERNDGVDAALRIVLGATYFWSGFHKFNQGYWDSMATWILQAVPTGSERLDQVATLLLITAPLVEAAFGLLLALGRFRLLTGCGLIMMHLGILLTIGPLGYNWNQVVWPWNCAMIGLLILFIRGSALQTRETPTLLPICIALLLWIAPAFYFVGLWPPYLSFTLYSGNVDRGSLIIASEDLRKLPSVATEIAQPRTDGRAEVSLPMWSCIDRGVCLPPEISSYQAIFNSLCKRHSQLLLVLQVDRVPRLGFGKSSRTEESCQTNVPTN